MIKQELILTSIASTEPPIRAAVIDDAFDKIKQGDIEMENFRGFMQIARQDVSYQQASKALNFPSLDFDEIEDDSTDYLNFLNFLWNERNYSEEFKQLLNGRLFQKKFQKIGALDKICDNLMQLGIVVKQIGSDLSERIDDFSRHEYNLVFIDYYLGESEDESAIQKAIDNIKLIHSKYPIGKKPATVLMSSVHIEAKALEFYERAQIMARPRFFHKSDLQNNYLIKLIAGILKKEFKSKDQLEKYGQEITEAADRAFNTFKERISKLSVEDFIFIQNTVLQTDKQPLGEYLEWLFGAFWGHVLFEQKNLRQQAEQISAFYIEERPVLHQPPSEIVGEMYMSALFDSNLKDIEPHPAFKVNSTDEDFEKPVNFLPYLHLGDLFVSEFHDEVWIVMNPQCDLERNVPKDRSIFLLPGKLVPIGKQPVDNESILRTEFFKFNNKCFRIVWDTKATLSKPIKDLVEWKKMQAVERLFKLRLPFAIELQQALVSTLSRVGLPVPPPLTQPLKIEVAQWSESDKNYKIILESDGDYCSRIVTKLEEKVKIRYMFTGRFILDLKRRLIEIHESTKGRLSKIDDGQTQEKKIVTKEIEKLNEILEDFDSKFLSLSFVETKKDTIADPGLGKIAVRRNHNLISTHTSAIGLFLINILDPEHLEKP